MATKWAFGPPTELKKMSLKTTRMSTPEEMDTASALFGMAIPGWMGGTRPGIGGILKEVKKQIAPIFANSPLPPMPGVGAIPVVGPAILGAEVVSAMGVIEQKNKASTAKAKHQFMDIFKADFAPAKDKTKAATSVKSVAQEQKSLIQQAENAIKMSITLPDGAHRIGPAVTRTDKRDEELKTLKKQTADMKEKMQKQADRINDLEDKLAKREADIKRLQEEIKSVREKLKKRDEELQSIKVKLDKRNDEIEALERQYDETKQELDAVNPTSLNNIIKSIVT